MKPVALCALLAGLCWAAPPRLLTYDASGKLLGTHAAEVRKGGYAYVPREALYGALQANLIDSRGGMNPVLFVAGEDAAAGVAEVFIGAQAAPGPDESTVELKTVAGAGHDHAVKGVEEAGAFGFILKLEPREEKDGDSGPLYDEHGLLAGWHAVKIIEGKFFAFAVPLDRLLKIPRTQHLSIDEWNKAHDKERESHFQRAMGYEWAGDYDGALFYFRKAAEVNPGDARAWLHLGFAEGKNGHGQRRMFCYRQAVKLDPSLAMARYLLGCALLMTGDGEGAAEQLEALKPLDEAYARRLAVLLEATHVDQLERHEHSQPKPKSGKA